MSEIRDLSTTDASNTDRFPENQAPSTLNNGARALEGLIARYYADVSGSLVSGGSGSAYTLTANRSLSTTYTFDSVYIFQAHTVCASAPTLNIDSKGAKVIMKEGGKRTLSVSDIIQDSVVMVCYEPTTDKFQMLNQGAKAASSALVDDTSPQLGGFLDANGNYMQREKGTDIASGSPTVPTDGDYFDVTGTTTIATWTVAADRAFEVQFDGVVTLTHHATTQDLPGEANITTAAGDVAHYQSTGANTVQCTGFTKADGTAVAVVAGKVAQVVTATTTSTISTSTAIPADDTIPQNDEGAEILTAAITPTNSSSKLVIWAHVPVWSLSAAANDKALALFKDSDANAIAMSNDNTNDDYRKTISLMWTQSAGSTSSQTFKLRAGGVSGTLTINVASKWGGMPAVVMTIMEVLP